CGRGPGSVPYPVWHGGKRETGEERRAAVEQRNQAGDCNHCDAKGCRSVPCSTVKRDADGCAVTCFNAVCTKRCPGGCSCVDLDCKKCDGGDCKKVESCPAKREVVEESVAVEEEGGATRLEKREDGCTCRCDWSGRCTRCSIFNVCGP
ncbi:hypothetical protein PMAYCL1PPCAC_07667, partial [Pristionchus mayeri]